MKAWAEAQCAAIGEDVGSLGLGFGAPRFGLGAGQQFLLEGDSTWKNFRNTEMDPAWDRGTVDQTWDKSAEIPYAAVADLRRICPEVSEAGAVAVLNRHGGLLRPALAEVLTAGTSNAVESGARL